MKTAKILIIAPHPDDEVLGPGGTVAKMTEEGTETYLCIVTKPYLPDWTENYIKNKRKEIDKSVKILGFKETFFLDFPTVKLDSILQKKINNSLERLLNKIKPEVIFIPHQGDINKDHQIVFEACIIASRPSQSNVKKILAYETLSSTEWGQVIKPFLPNVYVDVSSTFEKKIRAMKAYQSELKEIPHPRSLAVIEALARKRGSEAGVEFAEAFMLIREII